MNYGLWSPNVAARTLVADTPDKTLLRVMNVNCSKYAIRRGKIIGAAD